MIGVGRRGCPALSQVWLLGQIEPAKLRGAAGQAGTRELALAGLALTRDRAGKLGALDGTRWQLGLLAPDLGLGLAVEQRDELLGLDRLALEQQLGDRLQALAMLGQDVACDLVRALDDAADLVVDLARDLVAVVRLRAELAPEERLPVVVPEDARAELLSHAEAHDHLLGRRRDLLEVVRRARGDLAEDDLLRGAAAE